MHRRNWALLAALALGLGCAPTKEREESIGNGVGASGGAGDDGAGGTGAGDDGGGGTGGGDDGGGGTGGADDGGDDGTGDGGDGGDIKFDVAADYDIAGGPGDSGEEAGCEKVDFLFVIDNSGSMQDEQQNLITSFPGFISTIQQTLQAEDYHVMAIDTDATADGGISISCMPDPPCCEQNCQSMPSAVCNGTPCMESNDSCDPILGAGRDDSLTGDPCDIMGGNRYLIDGQPDLPGAFECAARVGAGGSGDEKQMQATIDAISTLNAPGQCNEGFVRDDAILVVTVITDEEDDPNDPDGEDENSPGDPSTWRQSLVDVKLGDEKAVVVLALVGDTDLPNPVCEPINGNVGAEPAPRLRELAESFTYGQWCSVCSPDYTPCFEEAVSIIDTACDEYVPPG
jgi:hypothetical protein